MNNKKVNKALSIVFNVIVYFFCALCLLMLVFTIVGKRDQDGAVKIFGYEMRVVLSGSMEKHPDVDVSDYKVKSIKTGSMVFIKTVPEDEAKAERFYSELKVGDVLTFWYDVSGKHFEEKKAPHMTITHRIIDIQPKDTGGYVITLRGDNQSGKGLTGNQTIDTSNEFSPNYVVGKVTSQSFALGWIAYSLKQPIGMALVIIVPCLIIIVWNVVKIVNTLNAQKAERQVAQRDVELETLKQRISELEQKAPEQTEPKQKDD